MNILYYIEPYYEFDNPEFRIPTIEHIIIPEIEKIYKEYGNQHKIAILSSNETLREIKHEIPEHVKIIEINIGLYKKYYTTSIEYSENTYLSKNENILNQISNEISKNCNYSPDIVVLYECSSENLVKKIFPNAKILHMMFGLFSRPPFPATTFYSTKGIFKNSEIANIEKRILSSEEADTLRVIRKRTMLCLAELNPLKKIISKLRSKYDNIIMVCCQIDNYFAYNVCSKYKTQYELVKEVLKKIPSNIGIVVTCHGEYKNQFTNEQLLDLEKNINLEFISAEIPYISQFIMPYIDGAITVSSSLGFQAALWGKPLIVPGQSQLSSLSISSNIDEIIPYINGKKIYNRDSILYDILAKYTYFDKHDLNNGKQIINIYNNVINNLNLQKVKNPKDIKEIFLSNFRGLILKNKLNEKNIKIFTDHFRVALSKSTAVSFDIFDTLILRPVTEPWYLFYVVEEKVKELLCDANFNFVFFRRTAEADVRRLSNNEIEITLEDIYKRFHELTGIEFSLLKNIMKIEIECEINFCKASRILKKEYEFSKLICKKISIISDIYLDKEIIKKILIKSGYKDYDLLLVSSNTKLRKHNGKLFRKYIEFVKNNWSILPKDCLHIGDNPIADLEMPRKYGMMSYCFLRADQNYEKSFISNYLKQNIKYSNIYGSFVSSLIANRWYNDTYNKIDKDSAFQGDAYIFGYCSVGPLVLGFIQWLHMRAKIRGNNYLYFLARDGWILKKAYNIFFKKEALPNSYLYCSRRCASVPSILNLNDILEIALRSFDARPLKDLLNTRFGILPDEIPKQLLTECSINLDEFVTPLKDQAKLRNFFKKIEDIIVMHAKKERELVIEYCNNNFLDKNILNGRPAFIDIGYSGSMQKYISKIYSTNSIDGYYFLSHFFSRHIHKNSLCDGFLQTFDDHKSIYRHDLNNYVFLFESILSSPEGSVINFFKKNTNIECNFLYDGKYEDQRIKLLNKIHRGCLTFINDAAQYRNDNFKNIFELPNKISEKILLSFAKNPKQKDASIFSSVHVENLYGGGSVMLIEQTYNNHPSNEEIKSLIQRSKWHEGAAVLYNYNNELVIKKEINPISINIRTKNQRLHNKLDKNPEKFFSDSKLKYAKIFNFLIFSKLPKESFFRKIIIKITHNLIEKMNN